MGLTWAASGWRQTKKLSHDSDAVTAFAEHYGVDPSVRACLYPRARAEMEGEEEGGGRMGRMHRSRRAKPRESEARKP